MNPIAIELGPLAIYWHSILVVVGILLAALLTGLVARHHGESPAIAWHALPWIVALGLLGARLYHVLAIPPSIGISGWYYLQHPLAILATWAGGLDAYGALLGGTAGLAIAIQRARRSVWRWLDIAAPGAALGQAIARWGNWINQERYGLPTDQLWGILIQPAHRLPGYEAVERFQPLFAYESAWNLLACLALLGLLWRFRDRRVHGMVAGIYFISYATVRFLLEFIRPDRPALAGIPIAQIVSLCIILIWAGLISWRLKNHRAEQQTGPA